MIHSSLDSDDDFRSGCPNVSQCHLKQSFSGLHSPGRSQFAELLSLLLLSLPLLLLLLLLL